ncbi:MAG: NADH-ubiquinone oxidoreductase-F iron-sulfur binding region domain-containing protein [Lachnospiraceae bacterium]
MKQLLVCNVCGDECIAPIQQYIMSNRTGDVVAGVEARADKMDADILYLLPEGFEVEGLTGDVRHGVQSVVTSNPYAVLQELKGKLPRPRTDLDLISVYEDHAITVISPEEAYRESTQRPVKFVAVSAAGNTSVMEVMIGTPVSELLTGESKAVLKGGLRGEFLLPSSLDKVVIGEDYLSDSLTVYNKNDCIVDTLAKLMTKSQRTSCGKCVLCREGTLQFKTILAEMTTGKARPTDLSMLQEVGELVKTGSYCSFGQNMPNTMLSAMELFPEEFEEHVRKKSCQAGVCYKAEAIHVILPDLCTGCEDCIDACPEEAIIGKSKFIHMIDQDMCEQCGKCVDACEEGAIVLIEGKLPKLPKKLTKVGKF